MKLMTYKRYPYTALLLDWTILNDANGTLVYHEVGDVDIDFATDPSAPRVVIDCARPLRRRVLLKNIRNRKGVYVMGDTAYSITNIEPNLTVFGDLEGFRMSAALNTEADWSQFTYA